MTQKTTTQDPQNSSTTAPLGTSPKPKRLPRYTSYPTALEFSDLDAGLYGQWLRDLPEDAPVSLYFHIPFCEKLCWFCGCFTKITSNYDRVHRYLAILMQEIHLVGAETGRKKVSHIHFGGGSPTIIDADSFTELMDLVRQTFDILPDAEIAVEIDPRTCSEEKVAAYAESGVNRVSLGIQDFNPDVQEAINRVQPDALIAENIAWFRAAGISEINFDLIYGMPRQTLATIEETVQKTAEFRPSRIALFGYAHVPWMKKHQQMMDKHHLPAQNERQAMFDLASTKLQESGYHAIGLDHFALPGDSLLTARAEGHLKRNFQGYSADPATTMIGFGASAIGSLPGGYAQNSPDLKTYAETVEAGDIPVRRGLRVSALDVMVREVISTLMSTFAVDPYAIAAAHGVDYDFAREAQDLDRLVAVGYLARAGNEYALTEAGRPYLRAIATLFDHYFPQQHSDIITRCVHESEG
ncbi:oxygen-independent coproporphyrinogen III oxidase [Paremcibacter congregatus]|uniref:Coproporphyrinogen-III oxidase n=1 Tax=Paremcibacter congregatus TaxID=2043170 RepID=A0A2G4YP11_9PROT|nr:oxygen-independent coproporphyrinogen III oxidase [Paremcibacter congregatus]PHZ84043.1 oxygen-independent coproporphyrinogen III oxidase [Paremcibacter congregatus]QDE25896.1 oxygen-independent coproporphyrinogen III oxidase [Paremcibacter congregatus]